MKSAADPDPSSVTVKTPAAFTVKTVAFGAVVRVLAGTADGIAIPTFWQAVATPTNI